MAIDSNTVAHIAATIGALAAAGYAMLPLLFWRRKLNLDALHTVADKVVAAIEQTKGAEAPGDTKKTLALDVIRSIVSPMDMTVPEPFIDAAVEAAVRALGQARPAQPTDIDAQRTALTDYSGSSTYARRVLDLAQSRPWTAVTS